MKRNYALALLFVCILSIMLSACSHEIVLFSTSEYGENLAIQKNEEGAIAHAVEVVEYNFPVNLIQLYFECPECKLQERLHIHNGSTFLTHCNCEEPHYLCILGPNRSAEE